MASVLGLWLVEEETVVPGDDGPDRKVEETGLGQTAAEGAGAPTALAHLEEETETENKSKGFQVYLFKVKV